MREETRPFRVLVTGSRVWDDHATIDQALREAIPEPASPIAEVIVVHGDCPTGTDALAAEWCTENAWWLEHGGITLIVEPHPADWATHGKAAGPLRNQHMVDLGANVALAFQIGNSRGTADCIRRAEKAGIPVRRYEGASRG